MAIIDLVKDALAPYELDSLKSNSFIDSLFCALFSFHFLNFSNKFLYLFQKVFFNSIYNF